MGGDTDPVAWNDHHSLHVRVQLRQGSQGRNSRQAGETETIDLQFVFLHNPGPSAQEWHHFSHKMQSRKWLLDKPTRPSEGGNSSVELPSYRYVKLLTYIIHLSLLFNKARHYTTRKIFLTFSPWVPTDIFFFLTRYNQLHFLLILKSCPYSKT